MKSLGILTALAIAFCLSTSLASSATCANATLSGIYGYQDTIQDSGGKFYVVGLYSFNGIGKGSNVSYTAHGEDGTIIVSSGSPSPFSYSVAPDCTFTFVYDDGGQMFSGVVVNNAKEFRYVESTGWQFRTGTANKVTTQDGACSTATLKGIYGYQDVYQDAAGKWYVVGLLRFDGKGKGTTNWTLHGDDGTVVQDSVGLVLSYAVNRDCTFTFTHDYNGITFSGVIANNGKELRYVESTGWQFRIGQADKVSIQNEQ